MWSRNSSKCNVDEDKFYVLDKVSELWPVKLLDKGHWTKRTLNGLFKGWPDGIGLKGKMFSGSKHLWG